MPDILKINLVLKLKIKTKNIGRDVINCTIRKSGFSFDNTLFNGKKDKMKIIKKENLLFILPLKGRYFLILLNKPLLSFIFL